MLRELYNQTNVRNDVRWTQVNIYTEASLRKYPKELLIYDKCVRPFETIINIWNNNVSDCVIFQPQIEESDLQHLPFVKIILYFEIKEFRKSSDLYNGVAIEDKEGMPVKKWELKRHHGDYEKYSIIVDNLNAAQFYLGKGQFKVKLRYYCLNHFFQDWYIRNVDLQFFLKSRLN